jgi:hypothetical protein
MMGMLATYGYRHCKLGESCGAKASQSLAVLCTLTFNITIISFILEEVHDSSDTTRAQTVLHKMLVCHFTIL